MAETTPGRLRPLSETGRTVADPAEDLRGRDVVGSDGEKVGTVEDLLVEEGTETVRFLRVASGGFLGIGEDHFLVPADAVAETGADTVRITRDRARMADLPTYDPDLVEDEGRYYGDVYQWWGYPPYWGTTIYPMPYL